MAGPFIGALRARWPRAHLGVLARRRVIEVLARVSAPDEVIEEKPHAVLALARQVRAGAWDISFSLSSSQGAAIGLFLARVPVRAGFRGGLRGLLLTHATRPLPRSVHRSRGFMELGAPLGARFTDSPTPEWRVLPKDRSEAGRFLRSKGIGPRTSLVAFAPGASYGPSNRWFGVRWAELADRLSLGRDVVVVMVGGPDEAIPARHAAGLMARPAVVAAGKLSLPGTAALLARCRAVVTNDSGLMHVGAALGVATLGLISSGNPDWTGPRGRNSGYLYAGVPCSPCYRRTCLPGRNYACLRNLTVEMVEAKLVQMAGI